MPPLAERDDIRDASPAVLVWLRGRPGLAAWLAAAGCALVLAFNAFRFPFLWDDFDFLGRASTLHLKDLLPDPSIVFYRPLSREVYFWVITHILGMSPLAAHILNAAVVGGTIALLMALVRRLAGNTAGLLAGLVFACGAFLPLEIAWACASQDLLCAFFVMLALYLQLQRKPLFSALAMAAALLSKETAIGVLPAAALLSAVLPRRSRADVVRSLGAYTFVAVAWVAAHPWTRLLLSGSAPAPGTTHMYLFREGALVPALIQGIAIILNFPWIVHAPKWPGHLILPAVIVSAFLVLVLSWRKPVDDRTIDPNGENPGLALLIGSVVLAGSIALTSLVLGGWSPHYVCVPALGLGMVAGPVLARLALPVRLALLLVFLWLGIGLRGNPIDPIVPTEPNFTETAIALKKVEHGFKELHPTLPPSSNVFVSVQARQSGGIYRHLFRFQPLRVWYRQPDIWVLDPNRRRQNQPNEFLFWIAPDLSVYEITLTDLAPHGPTSQISLPQYQKTLRGYALGLAGAGDVDRAVYIVANMPQTSKEVWAFDRRTAVALLYAAKRDEDAARAAVGVPEFLRPAATDAVVALLAEPIIGLDLDRAAMKAFGMDPDAVASIRDVMHRLEAGGYKLAAARFARRLLAIVPGDTESAAVLRRVTEKPSQEITVPIPYDIPQ